jgi:hypothetical protein
MEKQGRENTSDDGPKRSFNEKQTLHKLKEHDMTEFTHKCRGPKEPYTHHPGKSPIDL